MQNIVPMASQWFRKETGKMNFLEPRILRRKDFVRKDGQSILYLQVVISNRKKKIQLGIYVTEQEWDETEMRVRASHKHQHNYNMIIAAAVGKSMDILVQANINNKPMTVDIFEKHFTNFEARLDFIKWMQLKAEERIGNVSDGTYIAHMAMVEKFKKFRDNLSFAEFDLQVLKEFDKYLKTAHKNNDNTRHKNLQYLSYYVNRALEEDIRFENPFKKFLWPNKTNRIVFLDKRECKLLYDYYLTTDNLDDKKYLRIWFLMMSTGIRISDAMIVTRENVYGDMLVFTPKKTARKGHTVSIPITEFAKQFIDLDGKRLAGEIFKYSQMVCRKIKAIATRLGIKKNVTNHVARHTFATQFLLNGGDVLTLQKILDHSDINDTMVYVHITNEFKTQKMNSAFDLFFDGLKKNN